MWTGENPSVAADRRLWRIRNGKRLHRRLVQA
jgi:hypothetical protein